MLYDTSRENLFIFIFIIALVEMICLEHHRMALEMKEKKRNRYLVQIKVFIVVSNVSSTSAFQ